MNATVTLYMPEVDAAVIDLLHSVYGTVHHTPPLLRVTLPDDEDVLTPEDLHELLVTDFNVPVTLLVTPALHPLYPEAWLAEALGILPKGHYDLERLLFKVSQYAPALEKELKRRLDAVLTPSLIQTVLAFASHQMNVSLSAKALYMHRNTMHYRLSSFAKITQLDPYRFEVLALMYRFYHR